MTEGIGGGSHGKEQIASTSWDLPPAKIGSKKTVISALHLQGDAFCQQADRADRCIFPQLSLWWEHSPSQ